MGFNSAFKGLNMSPSVLSIWLFLQLRLALKCLNVRSLHARGRRLEASVHFYVFGDKLNCRSVPDAVGLNTLWTGDADLHF